MDPKQKLPGLYDPRFEHDNCGIGAVANIKGIKTHKTVDQALHIVGIDIDQEDALANFYTIESVPTFILMRKGEQLWRQSGELDLERLKKAVKDFKS